MRNPQSQTMVRTGSSCGSIGATTVALCAVVARNATCEKGWLTSSIAKDKPVLVVRAGRAHANKDPSRTSSENGIRNLIDAASHN